MPHASNDPCGAAMERRVNPIVATTRAMEKHAVRIHPARKLLDSSGRTMALVLLRRRAKAAQRLSKITKPTSFLEKPSWLPLKMAIHKKKRQEESPSPIPAARESSSGESAFRSGPGQRSVMTENPSARATRIASTADATILLS